jgi:DNA-binding Xre family transcriptional regulator
MTLREVWEGKGLTATDTAINAGISQTTLYKANRKEFVSRAVVARICQVLELSMEEFEALKPDRK